MSNKPDNLVGKRGIRAEGFPIRRQLVVNDLYAQDCTSREAADKSLVPAPSNRTAHAEVS